MGVGIPVGKGWAVAKNQRRKTTLRPLHTTMKQDQIMSLAMEPEGPVLQPKGHVREAANTLPSGVLS